MLGDKSELIKKRENDATITIENRIEFFQRFFLRNKETIIDKEKKRNGNF